MEYTLRVKKSSGRRSKKRLSPCFNGIYSQRVEVLTKTFRVMEVVILVLMEYTLREH